MANPTTNFGWVMPTPTDLVTDLPADFNVFGQAVDNTFVDLKGGTIDQILAKNSNDDMDFTWITNDVGDITAVTVTSPITGGGTSGSVGIAIQDASTAQKGSVQLSDSTSTTSSVLAATPTAVKSAYDLANGAIPKSLIDAAGDLILGTADNTAGRLAIGTTGKVLTSNGTTASWATPAGGGKVLQVVSTTYGTEVNTTSSSYVDTGLSLAITPTLNTSKILIIISQHLTAGGSSGDGILAYTALRGATTLFANTYGVIFNMGSTNLGGGNWGYTYLDSPATTSATTYKTQFKRISASGTQTAQFGSAVSTITLLEIGA